MEELEEVDYDPAALTLSDDNTQSPVRTTSGKEKKKKSSTTVEPHDAHIRSVESRDVKIETVDYKEGNSAAKQVDIESAAPDVEELETTNSKSLRGAPPWVFVNVF